MDLLECLKQSLPLFSEIRLLKKAKGLTPKTQEGIADPQPRHHHLLSFSLDPSTGSSAGKMYTLAGKFYAGMRGNCVQLDNSVGESSE